MNASTLAVWVLSILIDIGAARPAKVRADYPNVADAIALAAAAAPLYEGPDAEMRTAALEIAVAEAESGFDRNAVNGVGGAQIGLFQIHESNLKLLGLRSRDELYDPQTNAYAARTLFRISFDFCRAAKKDESWWLGPYASGRSSCEYGIDASKARMGRGAWLFARYAPR